MIGYATWVCSHRYGIITSWFVCCNTTSKWYARNQKNQGRAREAEQHAPHAIPELAAPELRRHVDLSPDVVLPEVGA